MIFIQRRYALARLPLIAVRKVETDTYLSIYICLDLSTDGDKRSTYGLKIIRYSLYFDVINNVILYGAFLLVILITI